MTEGSSQGLFVIVAVVIFGIFVVISYILFRDNLKTGLTTIFGDSIEQSSKNSTYNLLNQGNMRVVVDANVQEDSVPVNGKVILEALNTKNPFDGIELWGTDAFKKDNWYRINYRVKVLEGQLLNIGGHINYTEQNEINFRNFKVNGDNTNDGFYFRGGIIGSDYIALDGSGNYLISVDVFVRSDGFESTRTSRGFWIQPNRGLTEGNYKIEVSDFHAYKINN